MPRLGRPCLSGFFVRQMRHNGASGPDLPLNAAPHSTFHWLQAPQWGFPVKVMPLWILPLRKKHLQKLQYDRQAPSWSLEPLSWGEVHPLQLPWFTKVFMVTFVLALGTELAASNRPWAFAEVAVFSMHTCTSLMRAASISCQQHVA